jgi:hypothetical protein
MAQANVFKYIHPRDVVSTRTLLHEAIPITGTIPSGTYNGGGRSSATALGNEENIKDYTHGMFSSIYDYPYLSSSANHIFDLTVGYAADSPLSAAANMQGQKKINLYNEHAQVLMGYDVNGAIRPFDRDGDLIGTSADKSNECYFMNFSRLLVKDEIKKGTFQLIMGTGHYWVDPFNLRIQIKDTNAANDYRINSPAGEYGILYAYNHSGNTINNPYAGDTTSTSADKVGLIYYQAGVVVLSASIFTSGGGGTGGSFYNLTAKRGILSQSAMMSASLNHSASHTITGSTIRENTDRFRHRIYDLQFNNTTELNSTVYFCRVNHHEFNYSSNPTYLSESKVRVKTTATDSPVAYITSVGLYNDNNELLAVAKLSEPLRKSVDTEYTLRVRLDY